MSNSIQSQISCNDIVVIGTPISQLSSYEGTIGNEDYLVISKKTDSGNWVSRKYDFITFDSNYVHTTGNEFINGIKSFEKLQCGKVSMSDGKFTIDGGETSVQGTITVENGSNLRVHGNSILCQDGSFRTFGNVSIAGKLGFEEGSWISTYLNENVHLRTSIQSNAVDVQKVGNHGRSNVLKYVINGSENSVLSIGNSDGFGKNADVYVPNPGHVSDISSKNKVPTTKYIHDNYTYIPQCTAKYNYLSSLENEHDDDTVHKTKNETIVGLKTLSGTYWNIDISGNGYEQNLSKFTNKGRDIGVISEQMTTQGQNRMDMYVKGNPGPIDYSNKEARLTIGIDSNGVQDFKLNVNPDDAKGQGYGTNIATTKWTRDQMIELSDQTQLYTDIVSAPTHVEGGSLKSPSVTAVKDYNTNVIIPQTDDMLSNFLSNYLAYDFDGEGDVDNGRKVHLDKMRLVKFQAFYEHKDAEPIDFYVLTPLTSNI